VACLDARSGSPDSAGELLDRLTAAGVTTDVNWLQACLLADVAAELGDPTAAAYLHDRLAPHADPFAVIARGAGCYCSTELYLGRLAFSSPPARTRLPKRLRSAVSALVRRPDAAPTTIAPHRRDGSRDGRGMVTGTVHRGARRSLGSAKHPPAIERTGARHAEAVVTENRDPRGRRELATQPATSNHLAAALAERLIGDVIAPDHAEYEAARRVWNGMIDKRPAVIARCADAYDVATAVRFAAERGLPLAVRGTVHVQGGAT
jgi:hypothetical protein